MLIIELQAQVRRSDDGGSVTLSDELAGHVLQIGPIRAEFLEEDYDAAARRIAALVELAVEQTVSKIRVRSPPADA